ncbi:MAG: AmmeMemoRadiSam system protein A [Phycisphaerae bacterium]|nr:AmmeMemoRadiSam system protein A [Phycisphaerae bacterium]
MSTLFRVESAQDRRALLQIARATVEVELGLRAATNIPQCQIAGTYGGAFVTLWVGRRLRGCIGSFAQTDDIVESVREVTRSSLSDPRFVFHPITSVDLPKLNIEISVLSDLAPTGDPLSLVVGEHGIVVRRGSRSGCFLPKVATDHGWSAEEFLSQCCASKAGLSADAWRDPATQVLLFTADVFSEELPGGSAKAPRV